MGVPTRSRLTLTITRHYYDEILHGRKRVEYRRDSPYYRRVFGQFRYLFLVLHYRRGVSLVCQIRRVRLKKRPARLARSSFVTTPLCFGVEIAYVMGPWRKDQVATFFDGVSVLEPVVLDTP